MPTQVVNLDKVKQINLAVVYRLIDQQGPISRVQLAQLSQLAPASITKISRVLLDAELIQEVAAQQSTGGRRAISLTTNGEFPFLSVRIGRGIVHKTIYNLAGKVLKTLVTPLPATTEIEFLENLGRQIREFIGSYQQLSPKESLIAIAITLPGLVESGSGIIRYMPHYQLYDCHLKEYIKRQCGLPVLIGNDTRASALAETYFGHAQDSTDNVLVTIHQGTSAGIIINGDVFTYPQRDLGEIGHIQLDPLGERCQCGNIGCLETICSNPAILNFARTHLGQHQTKFTVEDDIEKLYLLASKGDEFCIQVVKRAANALGRALAIVINLFNPEKILLSGEILKAGNCFFDPLHQALQYQSLPAFREQTKIESAYFQKDSAIGGRALIKRAMRNGELLLPLITKKPSNN